jgi:predicted phage terminase large subunit-like protein
MGGIDEMSDPMEELRGLAHRSFPAYFAWSAPADPYHFGPHTNAILKELDAGASVVEDGGCYRVIVCVPPRHGKSDAVSRRFPPWFLMRNPNWDVILASYSADLTADFAKEARRNYRDMAPWIVGNTVDARNARWHSWGPQGGSGHMRSVGLGGTITGTGAHALIIDDYCKNREEAESALQRDKIWDSFRSDLWTRLAPNHLVVICATRWHEDDLVGRVLAEMKKDPSFPQFRVINFPAQSDAYPSGWLFPERFSPDYYESARKLVGSYAWQCLYQQDPVIRGGAFFKVERVKVVDAATFARMSEGLRFIRGWDVASSKEERTRDDPDYSVGTKSAWKKAERTLFIADVARGQWEAPERNRRMIQCAEMDGSATQIRVEVVAGYKDAYTILRSELRGQRIVKPFTPEGDKVSRSSFLEPIFEAGNVVLLRAPWNAPWIEEMGSFPGGRHDDQVDSLVISAKEQVESRGFVATSI